MIGECDVARYSIFIVSRSAGTTIACWFRDAQSGYASGAAGSVSVRRLVMPGAVISQSGGSDEDLTGT